MKNIDKRLINKLYKLSTTINPNPDFEEERDPNFISPSPDPNFEMDIDNPSAPIPVAQAVPEAIPAIPHSPSFTPDSKADSRYIANFLKHAETPVGFGEPLPYTENYRSENPELYTLKSIIGTDNQHNINIHDPENVKKRLKEAIKKLGNHGINLSKTENAPIRVPSIHAVNLVLGSLVPRKVIDYIHKTFPTHEITTNEGKKEKIHEFNIRFGKDNGQGSGLYNAAPEIEDLYNNPILNHTDEEQFKHSNNGKYTSRFLYEKGQNRGINVHYLHKIDSESPNWQDAHEEIAAHTAYGLGNAIFEGLLKESQPDTVQGNKVKQLLQNFTNAAYSTIGNKKPIADDTRKMLAKVFQHYIMSSYMAGKETQSKPDENRGFDILGGTPLNEHDQDHALLGYLDKLDEQKPGLGKAFGDIMSHMGVFRESLENEKNRLEQGLPRDYIEQQKKTVPHDVARINDIPEEAMLPNEERGEAFNKNIERQIKEHNKANPFIKTHGKVRPIVNLAAKDVFSLLPEPLLQSLKGHLQINLYNPKHSESQVLYRRYGIQELPHHTSNEFTDVVTRQTDPHKGTPHILQMVAPTQNKDKAIEETKDDIRRSIGQALFEHSLMGVPKLADIDSKNKLNTTTPGEKFIQAIYNDKMSSRNPKEILDRLAESERLENTGSHKHFKNLKKLYTPKNRPEYENKVQQITFANHLFSNMFNNLIAEISAQHASSHGQRNVPQDIKMAYLSAKKVIKDEYKDVPRTFRVFEQIMDHYYDPYP